MKILKRRKDKKGQGAVEFALMLPVLLLIVFGLIEFGRLLFLYMAVNSSGREAARYGMAVGEGPTGTPRYYDCPGIRAAAKNVGRFAGMEDADITIEYDRGPDTGTLYSTCEILKHVIVNHGQDPIGYGDRIKINVSVTYTPMLTYLSLDVPDFTMSANAFRTIVKDARVAPDYGAGSFFPTFTWNPLTPTPTYTPTMTPTNTATNTSIPTETPEGWVPTDTPTFTPLPPTATHTPGTPPEAPAPVPSWTQLGNQCVDIIWTWPSNGAWSSNPGFWPSEYQVWIDGVSQGTIPANDPNPTSWVTGISLSHTGSVTYGIQAIFSGLIGSEPAILPVTYDCEFGILIEN